MSCAKIQPPFLCFLYFFFPRFSIITHTLSPSHARTHRENERERERESNAWPGLYAPAPQIETTHSVGACDLHGGSDLRLALISDLVSIRRACQGLRGAFHAVIEKLKGSWWKAECWGEGLLEVEWMDFRFGDWMMLCLTVCQMSG